MNFHQSIFQNNNLKIIKYLSLIILIFALSFKANTEIPEKYKIESSLSKCKGTDYRKWTDCYSEYKFPRIEYKGEWKDGNFHGKGILKRGWEIYVGDFFENKIEGNGAWLYSNGDKYEGEFKDDESHGQGTYTYLNGDKYVGTWKYGGAHGQGTLIFVSGNKYVGEWEYNKQHGQGTYTYSNGNKYVGEHKDGKRHGQGTYTWPDGGKYVGEIKDDKYHGQGTLTWATGEKYVGEWEYNKQHGQGTLTWESGDKYIGKWNDGKKHGQGTYTWESGAKYIGKWKDGKKHGQGKMVYANGNTYEGLFEYGKAAKVKATLTKFTTDEKYYALIIGNNNYEHLEKLDAAENDARGIEKVLKEKYGFETSLLLSANYYDTAKAIINFTKKAKKNDNLLIYYAGHGKLEKEENRGYWLPTDAGVEQGPNWLGNDDIKNWIRASKAKHILLVIDSCFSGSLMRDSGQNKSIEKLTEESIQRLQQKKTRIVFTSGGEEPVVDSDGGSHSFFAGKLIKMLKNNNDVIVSLDLFQGVRQYVIDNTQQTPEHALIHGTGHDGGEFLFFPKS